MNLLRTRVCNVFRVIIGIVLCIDAANAEQDVVILKRRMDVTDDLVSRLSTEVEHLKAHEKLLQAQVEQLKVQDGLVHTLQTEVEHLKSQDRLQQIQIASLKTNLRYQQQRNSKFEILLQTKPKCSSKADLDLKDTEDTTGDHHIDSVLREKSNRIRRADIETPVAFFAKMDPHLEHAGVHQPIVFETVVTNIGNAYNNNLGSFIAPVSGIYVLSTTLVAFNHKSAHAQFVKNDMPVTVLYVSGNDATWDTTSQTIVLKLMKGDVVTVQSSDSDQSFYGGSHSIFSGFLLHQDFSSPTIVGK